MYNLKNNIKRAMKPINFTALYDINKPYTLKD